MQPIEFKAWFEGFTEAFSGMPTKAQWARIKERVEEIDGNPITERVFVDRWYPYIRSYPEWQYQAQCGLSTPIDCSTQQAAAASSSYNSFIAMNAVGRAEAAQISARGAS